MSGDPFLSRPPKRIELMGSPAARSCSRRSPLSQVHWTCSPLWVASHPAKVGAHCPISRMTPLRPCGSASTDTDGILAAFRRRFR